VSRKAYLASIVPVIVNSILNEHQIVIDIVAFVNKGDFPRSRLGEKQRGKILAGWVTRKMRTLAQFAIRDMDGGPDNPLDAHRASIISTRSGAGIIPGASSLRNMEHAPQILEQEELDHQIDKMAKLPPAELPARHGMHPGGPPHIDAGAVHAASAEHAYELPIYGAPDDDDDVSPGRRQSIVTPQIRLPGVDSREPELGSSVGGQEVIDEDSWTRDAIMHMNLASQMGK
jgi:hypothetical protein